MVLECLTWHSGVLLCALSQGGPQCSVLFSIPLVHLAVVISHDAASPFCNPSGPLLGTSTTGGVVECLAAMPNGRAWG